MVSRKIKDNIPLCVILLHTLSGTLPNGYVHETTLFDKYVRQVPTACTNPGSISGSSSHIHCAAGNHTHTASPSTASHTHTGTTDSGNAAGATEGVNSGNDIAPRFHTHTFTTSATAPATSVDTHASTHAHNTITSDPKFITTRFIKRTGSMHMRQKSVPHNSLLFWGCTLGNIPSCFASCTNYIDRHIKGVANACASPGTTGGVCCHTHNSDGSHDHVITIAAHTGHCGAFTTSGTSVSSDAQSSATPLMLASHTHNSNTFAVCNAAASNNTTATDAHTHDTISIHPQYKTVAYIKKTNINLRRTGIPVKSLVGWLATLASIPTGFGNADGTSGTFNYISKYPRGIPTACTNPSGTGGSDTHTHVSDAHSHASVSISHSHSAGGTTTVTTQASCIRQGQSCVPPSADDHSHQFTSVASKAVNISALSSGAHTHGSINNQPPTVDLALIQKL